MKTLTIIILIIASLTAQETNMLNNLYFYKIKPGRVIDGDTFVADEIDVGFGIFLKNTKKTPLRIRLNGIDAFESRKSKTADKKYCKNAKYFKKEYGITVKNYKETGLKAKEFFEFILKESPLVVIKTSDLVLRGSFGRILVDVYYQDESNKFINVKDVMLIKKLAHPRPIPKDKK